MRLMTSLLFVALSGGPVLGQVVSSEFFSDPVSEGWDLLQQLCDAEVWNDGGVYYQVLDFEACDPPGGGHDSYVRDIEAFNGVPNWFYEFRVSATGPRSEISGAAPTAFAAGNSFGELYRVVLARDQVNLLRDVDLPILFFDIEPGVPHTIRVELNNEIVPTYRWFIDGLLVDEGEAEDVFPSDNSRITWRGKAWFEPTENAWYYIRYGIPPTEHSGDFDSDSDIDSRDYFYFAECVAERGNGPGIPTDPGCTWADMDADGDVDFADFATFQRLFTGSE